MNQCVFRLIPSLLFGLVLNPVNNKCYRLRLAVCFSDEVAYHPNSQTGDMGRYNARIALGLIQRMI
jgi:hypothetical protein